MRASPEDDVFFRGAVGKIYHHRMTHSPTRISTALLLSISLLAVSACGRDDTQPAVVPSSENGTATGNLSLPEGQALEALLANHEYQLEALPDHQVRLSNGSYSDPATLMSAQLVTWKHSAQGFAAALLSGNAGGSGTFYELVILKPKGHDAVQQVTSLPVGDDLAIESMEVAGDIITLHYLGHSADDPKCCPTQAMFRSYRLVGDQLTLSATSPEGR